VSSFSHLDLDLTRVRPGSGVELLRNYLHYASTHGKRLGDAEVTGEPLNGFEAEVFDCLSAKGLGLLPQMGASRFRIDMVAEHPTKPGRYVLAIDCDGATYHSSYTARDRDRLRQQQLENLGWRFHRIWSTDWFMRKEDEIQRAMRLSLNPWSLRISSIGAQCKTIMTTAQITLYPPRFRNEVQSPRFQYGPLSPNIAGVS